MSTSVVVCAVLAALCVGALLYSGERRKERVAAEQARQAELVKAQEKERDDLRAMISERGIAPVGGMLVRRLRPRSLPFDQEAQRQGQRAVVAQGRLETTRRQVFRDGQWSVGFAIVVVILATAWMFFFLLQRFLDIQIMQDVGYPSTLSAALGTVIALGISVLGIVITGLLGLHPLAPKLDSVRASGRKTLAMLLLIPVLILVFALPPLAIYRSQSTLGTPVSQLQETLAEENAQTPPDPVEVAVTKQDLAAAQLRLVKGERLDRTLATVIPLLELVVSPAPIYLGELLVVLILAMTLSDARKKEQGARNEVAIIAQQFETQFTDLIVPVGGRPEDAERLLMGQPEALAPGDLPPDNPPTGPIDSAPPDDPPVADVPAPESPPVPRPGGATEQVPFEEGFDQATTDHLPNNPWSLA